MRSNIDSFIVFNNRFSGMIDAGISLVRSLHHLTDCPEPYGTDAERVKQLLMAGKHTLSTAFLGNKPIYPQSYISMVLTGEEGGILDITLRKATSLMINERRMLKRDPASADISFLCNFTGSLPCEWIQYSDYQKAVIQLLFCDVLGSMLSAGTSFILASTAISEILPDDIAGAIVAIGSECKNEVYFDPARLYFLPLFAQELIRQGMADGQIAYAFSKSGEILERELDFKLPGNGSGQNDGRGS